MAEYMQNSAPVEEEEARPLCHAKKLKVDNDTQEEDYADSSSFMVLKNATMQQNATTGDKEEELEQQLQLQQMAETPDDVNNVVSWWPIPEEVLLKVLWMLPIRDILSTGQVCHRWHQIANDGVMWRKKFQLHYHVPKNIELRQDAASWKSEYRRLVSNIPCVQTQRLEGHSHQVLHVSFSHNGEMFATCSKDGNVIIWNSDHPCTEKYSHNMKLFSWKYTQYSQFNQSDTLLLVSGVHFGSPHSTSGEIAVFTVGGEKSHLRIRVLNRPYDIFGTWFSDQYLISGDLHWLAHMISTSVLFLNKANQEIESEHVPIINQMYKFYNRNASSVRSVMVARCPWLNEHNDPLREQEEASSSGAQLGKEPTQDTDEDESTSSSSSFCSSSAGNPLSHHLLNNNNRLDAAGLAASNNDWAADIAQPAEFRDSTILYLADYREQYKRKLSHDSQSEEKKDANAAGAAAATPEEDLVDDEDESPNTPPDDDDELENSVPRYLIFSTGSKSYTPHQLGFKRIRNVTFPKTLDPGPSLKERIAARKRQAQLQRENSDMMNQHPDYSNYDAVADRFDKIDKVIDLHGHIIGMALSPDHRYLYVNTRSWPEQYIISNVLEPPPIAQEIDIHVIDMMTLKHVGKMLRSHQAFTASTDCFFIFLDVSESFVASGAEDTQAYLWDRYYGILLAKYKHHDIVNSVALNPQDQEMLVTTSDDYTIKIFRSRDKAKKLHIAQPLHNEVTEMKSGLI